MDFILWKEAIEILARNQQRGVKRSENTKGFSKISSGSRSIKCRETILVRQIEGVKNPSPQAYKAHLVGIGGIGVSALARWFLSQSYRVSGSDIDTSQTTKELKKEGVKIFIGHRESNMPPDGLLAVYSAAIKPNNPELKKAKKSGVILKTYAEALGDLSRRHKTIAVAGAHGKSTSTALLSLSLIKAGFDPTVIIGTKLKEFKNSNFRSGRSRYLVLEADEYQKSFLNYSPFAAMITNIDREHLDYYKNLGEIKKVFLKFIASIKTGGILIVNRDDKNLWSLKAKIQKIAKSSQLRVHWYGIRVNPRLYRRLSALLKIPGEHNISNAMGVYTLAKALGVKEAAIPKALASYRGAWRRMEYKGNLKSKISDLKIEVYDDYAHHPTEIKATLAGIARKWPKSRIICVFQPHQAQRLASLFGEFSRAFFKADALILLDIFKVAGRDKIRGRVNSKKLAEAIQRKTKNLKTNKLKNVIYLPSPHNLKKTLLGIIRNSHHLRRFADWHHIIIVMMGAGDIVNYTKGLVEKFKPKA